MEHTFVKICGLIFFFTFWATSTIFAQNYPTAEQYLPVATINQDRLFNESSFGNSFSKYISEKTNLLAEENNRIQRELEAEEISLTEKRQELPNDEFRQLADTFNQKVETIREQQAEKLGSLNALRLKARQHFFTQAQPAIVKLMQERGIQFILNEQAIFIAGASGDITNSAIEKINIVIPTFNETELK